MTNHNDTRIEKQRIAIGSAAIIATVAVASALATLMGISQMA